MHGFSFSAGAFDYIINLHLSTKGWLLIPIGLATGFVYYVLFRWAILRFRLPTPGREEGSPLDEWAGDIPYRAPLILQAIGGKDNIVQMEACITRLRLKLVNDKKLDINALRSLGFDLQWRRYPMQHAVCAEEIRDLGDWMGARFAAG